MRLFLSSENLGNYPEVFLRMLGPNKKLAVVHNAIDYWTANDKQAKVDQHHDQLVGQGFEPIELDLKKFFNKTEELAKILDSFGGIFLFGGNTFILRRAMAYSGLDQILIERLTKDELAYGGSSAGAIIPTPSLRGSELGDEPDNVPSGYKPEIIWDGLNLVRFHVIPHYGSDWWGKEAVAMQEYLKSKKLHYKIVRDGQVIVVNGDKDEFLK